MFFIKTTLSFLKDEDYREIVITSIIVLAMGTTAYHFIEGWRWIDAFYFSFITLTTVGFGDFYPQTDAGKIFTVFYIIIGLGMILSFVQLLYNHYNEAKITTKREKGS